METMIHHTQPGVISFSLLPWSAVVLLLFRLASSEPHRDFYSFQALDAHGKWISMDRYRGKVLLLVNVASECGYTDNHYKDLVQLQEDLGQSGKFQVLAFPCNQFGGQEPMDSSQVLHFVTEKYNVNFPVFHKINVIMKDIPDLWKYLEEMSGKVPNWNFWKYLLDSEGKVIDAWGPWISVEQIYSVIRDTVAAVDKTVASSPPLAKKTVESSTPLADHQDL